ncbi:HAD hydrolase-like protein [Candidatus Woesearchaeota archaeon]|nr:HAD hydrolase-like protein [Candidatus Woesearchaeota archaeon]
MKLIIFDVDGVLEKEEEIMKRRKEALAQAIADKLEVSFKEGFKKFQDAKKNLPKEKKTTSAYLFMEFGFTRKKYFEVLDGVDPEGIIDRHDNCLEMLKELKKRGYTVITYTNSSKKSSVKTLKVLGIHKYIDRVYSTEEFTESKPSTKNILKMVKDMGFDKKNTVMVGNSLEKDITPPYELGIKAILFDSYKKYKSIKEGTVIHDLIEVLDLV